MSEYNIGSSIKKLRLAKKLTLQSVAAETGFSAALLSQIENDNVSPPIATLSRLAKFFDVRITRFFADAKEEPRFSIVRAGERPVVPEGISEEGSGQGYLYQSLSSRQRKKMAPFMVTVTGNARKADRHSHEGEEFIFIRSGSANFQLEDQTFTLHQGDALYFDASHGHRLLSREGMTVEAMVVVTR